MKWWRFVADVGQGAQELEGI
ncbi:hypothetical protein AND4_12951 [Vibrio sp. AND4]|nr:hypothetical protein AND4_12951 [Vibrio sp. AND4]